MAQTAARLTGRLLIAIVPGVAFGLAAVLSGNHVDIALLRTNTSRMPPWTYEADSLRYFGTVVEPLCAPPTGLTYYSWARPVGERCEIHDEAVEVELREDLTRGAADTPVGAVDVRGALDGYAARLIELGAPAPWAAITTPTADTLRIKPADGTSAASLLRALSMTPVAWEGALDQPEGTGTFAVKDYSQPVCVDEADGSRCEDALTLERRTWSWRGANTVVFHGVEGVSPAQTASQLDQAFDQGRWHLALGVEAPIARALAPLRAADASWTIAPQPDAFVLWAVANPARETPPAALAVLRALSQNPMFLDAVGANAPAALLPPQLRPFGARYPAVPPQAIPGEAPACAPAASDALRVLTNPNWHRHASLVVAALKGAGLGACLVDVPSSSQEDALRKQGGYDISMLAVRPSLTPAAGWFLAESLPEWFGDPGVEVDCAATGDRRGISACARAIAEQEIQGEPWEALQDLTTQLDRWVVALAVPRSVSVIAEGVAGYDAERGGLLSEQLSTQSPQEQANRARQGALVAGVWSALVLAGFAVWDRRVTRTRAEATLRRVRMRQHDLGRPLVRAKQLTDALPASSDRELLLVQLDEALDRVDGLSSSWAGDVDSSVGTLNEERMVGRTLKQALDNVRARFGPGSIAEITWEVLEPDPIVVTPRGGLMRLLENVLENAIKYRGDAPARLALRMARTEHEVVVLIEDHGLGLPPGAPLERIFELGVRLVGPEAPPGTGTGLASALEIARAAGGTIRCVRRARPTTFEIRLPISA